MTSASSGSVDRAGLPDRFDQDAGHPIRLTAHPLQRIGAYALACLASPSTGTRPDPEAVDAAAFDAAIETMTKDAIRAALGPGTKTPEGFFLKSSHFLFPNSAMNHPSNGKRGSTEITERVIQEWRRPDEASAPQPQVACTLCSRPASGFYGKRDVPLAESDAYRNTTPPGHRGLALCWPCLCCFHALPYGSQLTGGPSRVLHSWDERFLARTVARQVVNSRQVIEFGAERHTALRAPEVLALRALRGYEEELRAGVELLVYSNNNRGPTLEVVTLDQPMADWLRRTMNRSALKPGFRALLRAHQTAKNPGYVGLARNAFRTPEKIPAACATYLATAARSPGHAGDDGAENALALAVLCFDYADKVMLMDNADLQEIKATGSRIATLIIRNNRPGKLLEFYSKFKAVKQLRSWLQREAIDWVLHRRDREASALLTTRGFGLLFDPDMDNQAWFHRQMLLVAVVEELYQRNWRPEKDEETEAVPEIELQDDEFAGSGDGEE